MIVAPEDLDAVLGLCGWQRDPRMLQRWRSPGGAVVDVLPANDALLAAGEIRFGGGAFAMSLVGFDLAMRHTVQVTIPASEACVEVASLAALVVLKIVAWLDRPYDVTAPKSASPHAVFAADTPSSSR